MDITLKIKLYFFYILTISISLSKYTIQAFSKSSYFLVAMQLVPLSISFLRQTVSVKETCLDIINSSDITLHARPHTASLSLY